MAEHFNWLHLTDLHFGQQGQGPLWPNIRDKFFEDLATIHDRCGPWHAVLFTGDLVYSGQRDQFERLETDVLGRLWDELKALGSADAVLLAVPGNHDLARPKQLSAVIRHLIEPQLFDSIADEFWSEPSGEYRQAVTETLGAYSQWWATTRFRPPSIRDGLLPGDFGCTLEGGGRRIGIIGLNTTFLQLSSALSNF
jgi:3',5'-cyclic AMP phosphodiesterase CpdA